MTVTAPFDAAASTYDDTFTDTQLGQWLRQIVREHIPLQADDRVLELGCGTGEDALWMTQQGAHVTATDASAEMLQITDSKLRKDDLLGQQQCQLLDLNAPESLDQWNGQAFDGVFSNFGVLNCAEDLPTVAQFIAERTQSGGWAALVLMNPVCAWEIAWYAAHLDLKSAFRRLKSAQHAHAGKNEYIRVWYPSAGKLKRAFSPWFEHERTLAIGTLLPPSYLNHLVERYPALFARFTTFDRGMGTHFHGISDHYMIVMRRR